MSRETKHAASPTTTKNKARIVAPRLLRTFSIIASRPVVLVQLVLQWLPTLNLANLQIHKKRQEQNKDERHGQTFAPEFPFAKRCYSGLITFVRHFQSWPNDFVDFSRRGRMNQDARVRQSISRALQIELGLAHFHALAFGLIENRGRFVDARNQIIDAGAHHPGRHETFVTVRMTIDAQRALLRADHRIARLENRVIAVTRNALAKLLVIESFFVR